MKTGDKWRLLLPATHPTHPVAKRQVIDVADRAMVEVMRQGVAVDKRESQSVECFGTSSKKAAGDRAATK